MYVIVAGGGKVGFYLARELVAQGHEVLVIEKSATRVDAIANELGNVVLKGNADEASVLAEAGGNRADVVCAVTGDDEDNLVICQVAKRRFNVPRTVARINNPANESIFRLLGIDATVSSTEVILSVIEQEIPSQALVPLLRLRHADLEVVDARLPADSPLDGIALRDLPLPPESLIAIVIRNGEPIFPGGGTTLRAGDELIALTRSAHEEELRDTFFARR
ncbi:MAG: TrkA family potassium uptake protein [Chloroflexota bacterium]|nr:TrkA family potassium uptake protein [Chloroflexota bacterium]